MGQPGIRTTPAFDLHELATANATIVDFDKHLTWEEVGKSNFPNYKRSIYCL
jgi:hypothetical protein